MGPCTVPGVRVGREGEAVLLGPAGDAPVAGPRPGLCGEEVGDGGAGRECTARE